MDREIKFRARWRDTGKLIRDFMDEYNLYHLNDEKLIIEQYTGLKDKNCVEIYEGDVVYIAGYGNYTVEFPFIELYEAYPEGGIGEVIGNIHENPELL